MRFEDGLEVDVVRPGGGPAYPEASKGQDRYIVATPGQPFEVRVRVPQTVFSRSISDELQVILKLDGAGPGTSGILTAYRPLFVFKGWITDVSGQQQFSQFMFGDAQRQTDTASGAAPAKTGLLTVGVYETYKTGSAFVPPPTFDHSGAGRGGFTEGKKWFLQPSINIEVGALTTTAVTFLQDHYRVGNCLALAELRLETATVLELRKVLDNSNPEHCALIQQAAHVRMRQLGMRSTRADAHIEALYAKGSPTKIRKGSQRQKKQRETGRKIPAYPGSEDSVNSPDTAAARSMRKELSMRDIHSVEQELDQMEAVSKSANFCDLTGDGPKWSASSILSASQEAYMNVEG